MPVGEPIAVEQCRPVAHLGLPVPARIDVDVLDIQVNVGGCGGRVAARAGNDPVAGCKQSSIGGRLRGLATLEYVIHKGAAIDLRGPVARYEHPVLMVILGRPARRKMVGSVAGPVKATGVFIVIAEAGIAEAALIFVQLEDVRFQGVHPVGAPGPDVVRTA